jgi:hypothetical protein
MCRSYTYRIEIQVFNSVKVSEKDEKFSARNGGVSNGHPKWVYDVWGFVIPKHEGIGESIIDKRTKSGMH